MSCRRVAEEPEHLARRTARRPGKTSWATKAKLRYLPIRMPSRAVPTATTWSSGPRRPPGRAIDREGDQEADPEREDAGFVAGPLDDQPPGDPAEDGGDDAREQRGSHLLVGRGLRLGGSGETIGGGNHSPGRGYQPSWSRPPSSSRSLTAGVRSRLCARRHSSTRPWSPERSTSGTCQPRNSAGRV